MPRHAKRPGRWRKLAAGVLIAGIGFGAGYGVANAAQPAPRPAAVAEHQQPARECKPVVVIRQAPPRFVLAPRVLHVLHVWHVLHVEHVRAEQRK